MKLVPGHAICACGWHGDVGAKDPCPACSRPATARMDAARVADLQAVRARADAPLEPGRRITLIRIGVIAPAGKRPAPRPDGARARPPKRPHVVTALGLAVLATVDALGIEPEGRGVVHRFATGLPAPGGAR